MAELFPKISEMRIKRVCIGFEQLQVILGWEDVSEQIQGVGQGAGLDTAHPELILPFMVGLGALSPAPTPESPPERSLGGPRPAGLLHPGSAPRPLCSQNGNQENPSCCGIDGILEAYHHSLRTVQLYGPTNFAPVVTHVAR